MAYLYRLIFGLVIVLCGGGAAAGGTVDYSSRGDYWVGDAPHAGSAADACGIWAGLKGASGSQILTSYNGYAGLYCQLFINGMWYSPNTFNGSAPVCPANSSDNGSSCSCSAGYDASAGQCVQNTCPASGSKFGPFRVYPPANSGDITLCVPNGSGQGYCEYKQFNDFCGSWGCDASAQGSYTGGVCATVSSNFGTAPSSSSSTSSTTGATSTSSTSSTSGDTGTSTSSTTGATSTSSTSSTSGDTGTSTSSTTGATSTSSTSGDTGTSSTSGDTGTSTTSSNTSSTSSTSGVTGSTSATSSTSSTSGVTGTSSTTSSTSSTSGVTGTSSTSSTSGTTGSGSSGTGPCPNGGGSGAGCSGDGNTFSGACKAGFSCDGDAVLCATAVAVNDMYCALQVSASDTATYDAEKIKTGVNNNPSDLKTISASTFDTSDAIGGGGNCVNDLTITVWGYSVVLPISSICPYAVIMGYLLVAVTFIICLGIITA